VQSGTVGYSLVWNWNRWAPSGPLNNNVELPCHVQHQSDIWSGPV
jgi:hypothetical protein